ncbi:MAG: hypothetical protein ABEI11_00075 [Haloarculaceae archaeon]
MATSSYSASAKGGGNGATAEARAKILNHIDTYIRNARWADSDRADRVFEKVFEAPERYISPNPDTWQSYHAEASRIYHKIKDDHGLRLESELNDVRSDYEARAEQHLRREIEDQVATFGPDVIDRARRGDGDVPREVRERVDSVLAHHTPDVYDAAIRDARAIDESAPDADAEPEPTPEDDTAAAERDDETGDETGDTAQETPTRREPADMPLPELLGRVAAHKLGGVLSGAVSFLALVVSVLAPLLARATVEGAHYTGRAVGWTLRTLATILTVACLAVVAFGRGVATELRSEAA